MSQPKVTLAHIRFLLLDTLLEKKGTIAKIVFALFLLAISQALFVLLTGPLFKMIFGGTTEDSVSLLTLAPESFHNLLPFLKDIIVSKSALVKYVPGAVLLAGMLMAFAGYTYQYNQQALTLYVGSRYREKLFRSVLRQPLGRLLKKAPGEWMSLIMNDVAYLQSRLSDLLVGLVKDSITVLSALVALSFYHWPTALFLVVLSIPLMFGTGQTGKKISTYAESWQKSLAEMSSAILEMRKRFEYIRAQGGESLEATRFQTMNRSYFRMISRSILMRSAFAPGLEFLGFAFLALIIFLISRGVMGKGMESAQLLQVLTVLGIIIRPLRSIGEQISRLQETGGIIRRSVSSFQDISEIVTPERIRSPLVPLSALSIRSLELGYGEGFSLKAKDLFVKAGEAVAIIGPSGGGKSTLIRALAGLYEPKKWEGTPSFEVLRDNAALVSQKPFLFSGSISSNLSYGLSEVPSEEKMRDVLSSVELWKELKDKGSDLTSELDFLQGSLSGGQKQRLTIARGLLRPESLWLMDEVTSAIDPRAEEAVTKTVIERSRTENRILLYVTHRFSQLSEFDQIWFCEAGGVTVFKSANEWQNHERVKRFIESENHP